MFKRRRRRPRNAKLEPLLPLDCAEDEGLVEAMAGIIQESENLPFDAARKKARYYIYGHRRDATPATEETPC